MALFVVAPILIIAVYAFTSSSGEFTLDNFRDMTSYAAAFGRSFLLAGIATAVCILIGYPLAYFLAREQGWLHRMATMLIMLPMWMNFLLRTYSWSFLLERNGLLNRLFGVVHLFDLVNGVNGLLNDVFGFSLATDLQYFQMIDTRGAIVLGMVYNFLPYMVLPIFSVIEKIDNRVVEAAQDLGADHATVFRRVIFPLSLPGVLSGITMVFIPSVSTFAISGLLGGQKTLLLGNLIDMQLLGSAYNPHLGSAISLVMMAVVMACMAVMNRFGDGEQGVTL